LRALAFEIEHLAGDEFPAAGGDREFADEIDGAVAARLRGFDENLEGERKEGVAREDVRVRLGDLAAPGRLAFFDMPRIDVSSSDVRRRVAAGRPVRHLVPDRVAALIADRGLYRLTTPATLTPMEALPHDRT